MATPRNYYTTMVGIFKNFLWGGAQLLNKWALVSWTNITKPKMVGGLCVKDPFTLNQVMGLWWRWVKGGQGLWKNIWTRKYRMSLQIEDIL